MNAQFRISVVLLAGLAWLPGCVADHNGLAEQPASGGAGNAGAGGRAAKPDAAMDGASEAGTTPEPEPDTGAPTGTFSLTFLHGVTDSPWIAFCVAPVHDGKTGAATKPFPASGLDYGHSVTVDAVPGVDVSKDGVAPFVVAAAAADAVKGLGCAQIFDLAASLSSPPPTDAGVSPTDGAPQGTPKIPDGSVPSGADASNTDAASALDGSPDDAGMDAADTAPPPVPIAAVRVAALPVIPAGAFSVPRGYLVVAGGCLGGRGVTDPSEQSVCGEGYTPSMPTLTEIVVSPPLASTADRVGLQVLGAAPAVTQFDLELVPASQADAISVATRVVPGALRPPAPYTRAAAGEIGANSELSAIQLFAFGGGAPVYDKPWARTLEAGMLDGVLDRGSYTLVLVGPFPGFAKRLWWNDPLVTIVRNR